MYDLICLCYRCYNIQFKYNLVQYLYSIDFVGKHLQRDVISFVTQIIRNLGYNNRKVDLVL